MLDLLSLLAWSLVMGRLDAIGRSMWQWGIVEVMGRRKHVGRYREVNVLGGRALRVEALRHEGGFEAFTYHAPALLSVRELSEAETRRGAMPNWAYPCGGFRKSSIVEVLCALCGHDLAAHEAQRRAYAQAANAQETCRKVAKIIGGPGVFEENVHLRWDRDDTEGMIFDVEVCESRIKRSDWDRLVAATLPILAWESAAARWEAVDVDALVEVLLVSLGDYADAHFERASWRDAWFAEIQRWTPGEQHEARQWAWEDAQDRWTPPPCLSRLPGARLPGAEKTMPAPAPVEATWSAP